MALTGRFDFRKTLTGKIVLRVEEEVPAFWSRSGERPMKRRWRDATLMDLTGPELRMLMDLRFRPQFMARFVEVDRTPAPSGANVVPLPRPDALEGIAVPASQVQNAPPTRTAH